MNMLADDQKQQPQSSQKHQQQQRLLGDSSEAPGTPSSRQQAQEQQQRRQQSPRQTYVPPPPAPGTYEEMNENLLSLSTALAPPPRPHRARHSDRDPALQHKTLRSSSFLNHTYHANNNNGQNHRSTSPTADRFFTEEILKRAYAQLGEKETSNTTQALSAPTKSEPSSQNQNDVSAKSQQFTPSTIKNNSNQKRPRVFVRTASMPSLGTGDDSDSVDEDELLFPTGVERANQKAKNSASGSDEDARWAAAPYSTPPHRPKYRRSRSGSCVEGLSDSLMKNSRGLDTTSPADGRRGVEVNSSGSSAGSSVISALLEMSDSKTDESCSASSMSQNKPLHKGIGTDEIVSPPKVRSSTTAPSPFIMNERSSDAAASSDKKKQPNTDVSDVSETATKKAPSILQVSAAYTTSISGNDPLASNSKPSPKTENKKKSKKDKKTKAAKESEGGSKIEKDPNDTAKSNNSGKRKEMKKSKSSSQINISEEEKKKKGKELSKENTTETKKTSDEISNNEQATMKKTNDNNDDVMVFSEDSKTSGRIQVTENNSNIKEASSSGHARTLAGVPVRHADLWKERQKAPNIAKILEEIRMDGKTKKNHMIPSALLDRLDLLPTEKEGSKATSSTSSFTSEARIITKQINANSERANPSSLRKHIHNSNVTDKTKTSKNISDNVSASGVLRSRDKQKRQETAPVTRKKGIDSSSVQLQSKTEHNRDNQGKQNSDSGGNSSVGSPEQRAKPKKRRSLNSLLAIDRSNIEQNSSGRGAPSSASSISSANTGKIKKRNSLTSILSFQKTDLDQVRADDEQLSVTSNSNIGHVKVKKRNSLSNLLSFQKKNLSEKSDQMSVSSHLETSRKQKSSDSSAVSKHSATVTSESKISSGLSPAPSGQKKIAKSKSRVEEHGRVSRDKEPINSIPKNSSKMSASVHGVTRTESKSKAHLQTKRSGSVPRSRVSSHERQEDGKLPAKSSQREHARSHTYQSNRKVLKQSDGPFSCPTVRKEKIAAKGNAPSAVPL